MTATVTAADIAARSRVLVVGVGDTGLVRELVTRGAVVTAVDPDVDAAERAAPWCDVVVVGDLSDLDLSGRFANRRFARVVVGDVLGAVADPAAALERCSSVLEPGGRLVVSVANLTSGARRLAAHRARSRLGGLDRVALDSACARAGLHVLERGRQLASLADVGVNPATLPPALVAAVGADPEAGTDRFVWVASRTARALPPRPAPVRGSPIAATAALDERAAELESDDLRVRALADQLAAAEQEVARPRQALAASRAEILRLRDVEARLEHAVAESTPRRPWGVLSDAAGLLGRLLRRVRGEA